MNIKDLAPMAIPYNGYRYLWPPRPELKLSPEKLEGFKEQDYIAQPKLNGSNTLVFMDETDIQVMNRHNENKTGIFTKDLGNGKAHMTVDFFKLHRGKGWMVLNGEWMEKSKKDEAGNNYNGNFVIFDILVYNGFILTGATMEKRIRLLSELYGSESSKKYLFNTGVPNVLRVKSYAANFASLYHQLAKVDMYEGIVLKRKGSKLLPPFSPTTNTQWSIKIRKTTKIYHF